MPLSTTRVILSDWSDHHKPVVAGTRTGRCEVWRPGTGPNVWDEEAQTDVPPPPAMIWEGTCRVQSLDVGSARAESVGEVIPIAAYLVAVDADVPEIIPGNGQDWIRVTESGDDPQLVGRDLRIISTAYGTLRWERDIWCADDMSANADESP